MQIKVNKTFFLVPALLIILLLMTMPVAYGASGSTDITETSTTPGVVSRYDLNGNCIIDRPEAIRALRDYSAGEISRGDAISILRLYLSGTAEFEFDKESLMALYNATGGANWTNNSGWLTDAPLDQWHGVTTNHCGRVTSLNLGRNQLSGELPTELGNLTSLHNLSLHTNQLSGGIPEELGNLASLQSLWLPGNRLTGEIPAQLGNLTSLTGLHLANNQLSGGIPAQLGDLTNLTGLWLDRNQLSGDIPAELSNLTGLENLYLSGNQLTGTIPASLGDLTSLTELRLDRNRLTGEIPAQLGDLTSLTGLRLYGNQLAGVIPAELSNLTALENLILSGNQLTGTIPTSLGNLTNLTLLALNNNELSGEIPASLGNLTSLEILSLRDNQLTGEIPAQLGNLSNLEIIHLAGNQQLTGCVPVGLKDVPDNDFARLGLNFCDGTPPPQEIVFAEPNWHSVRLQTYIAQYIVENGYGYSTRSVPGSFQDLTQSLASGDINVLMEVWLPVQSEIWEPILEAGDVLDLGTSLGHDWQSAFVIPAYLQEQYPGLDSVEDLKDQRYKNLFQTAETGGKARLLSCVVGWDCEGINREQVTGYGLDDHVHVVNPASGEALLDSINDAYQRREPWLGYMWGTANPALLLDLVRLEEPSYSDECWETTKACAYEDSAILIGAHSGLPSEAPDVADFLRKWDFSIEVHLKSVTRWQADNGNASIEDTGLHWLGNNEDAWSGWVTSEAAARIRTALSHIASDREALVALYNASDGPNWNNNSGWLTDAPIGQWHGVTTDVGGRVTRLSLPDNRLSGEIPAALGSLTSLQGLTLHRNQLTGEIPAELGNLTGLRNLTLYSNQLSGEIPGELGNLVNLRELPLHRNQLSGEIPAELGSLTRLEGLWLYNNQLSGEIPAELGSLTKLRRLNLSNNQLTGEIPMELGDLDNLTDIRLAGNQLTGCVPASLQDVPENDFERLGLDFCGP